MMHTDLKKFYLTNAKEKYIIYKTDNLLLLNVFIVNTLSFNIHQLGHN